jgi:dTDP-4-dehydrorhamnose 3,5-epimerase
MRFVTTAIDGVVEVGIEWHDDERGRFGRTFCTLEFAEQGLSSKLSQCSVSSNIRRGTVRGFHFQTRPHEEAKLVQCVAGRLFDVALDVRPGSATFGKYHAVELSAESGRMLFIPGGCAHAFQTLEDATSLIYYISSPYHPESGSGVAWDDPAIGVPWPVSDAIVSERDRRLPRLVDLWPVREKLTGMARGPNA